MILIRRASPEDAEQLTQITLASKRHWNYPEEWIQRWLPELTFLPEYVAEHEMWLFVVDEKSAAYYSLKQNDDSLWLENLWVLPGYMGQGMGRMLFQHALERSRALGASTLKIESDPNAQSFYEKMGAKEVSEHQYELDGQLRVLPIMEINL
jgi:GNAT superfamily N-acetyltransferase